MNKLKLLVLVSSFAALSACAHRSRHAERAQPTPAEAAQANLNIERDTYVAQTQTRIDEMSKFAAALRTRAETAQKPQAKKLQNASDDMETALKDAQKELADVKTAATENWIDEKRDVTKTMQQAEQQYSNSVHLIQ